MKHELIKITIPGTPQGKGRARAFVRNGHVSHYTPEKTRTYEGMIATIAMDAMKGRRPSEKPLSLSMAMFFEIPRSWPAWKIQAALQDIVAPTTKPDIDNIEKAVKDAFNAVVWKDDCQVCSVTKAKFYDDRPRIEVTVHELDAHPAQIKKRIMR